MDDHSFIAQQYYITTADSGHRAERIDAVLARRMREFLLSRQQRLWQEGKK